EQGGSEGTGRTCSSAWVQPGGGPESLTGAEPACQVRRIAAGLPAPDRALLERAAYLAAERDRLLEVLRWRLGAQPEVGTGLRRGLTRCVEAEVRPLRLCPHCAG